MTIPVNLVQTLTNQQWSNNLAAYQWSGLGNTAGTNTGTTLGGPGYTDYSVQIEGIAGAGFGLVIEGSNDGVNFHTLNDPFGNALTFTSTGQLKQITEIVLFVRPRVTAGDSNTNVTVTMARGSHIIN